MKINRIKFPILALLVFSLVSLASAGNEEGLNCFTVLVGKKASADGSVMIAHNEDDRGDIIVNLRKIAPRDYRAPRKIDLGRGGFFPTDGRVNGFLWIEATTQEFADSFINEFGVVITSDSCSSRETKGELTDGGIGYMLRRIVAEKAKSAKEAVLLAGKLVELFGYRASGRTYSFADKNEAWMMAVVQGRHWVAQRVPDDEIAIIPNYYTIRGVNLDDSANYLGSKDLAAYAAANGWYNATNDGPLDFKKAYSRSSTREFVADGNTLRHWRGLTLLTGREWEISGDYPFSVKPGRKVTAEALMAVLRDHYEGTEYDATLGYQTGSPNKTNFRTICTASTINSFIVSLDAAKPSPLSIAIWLALGKPDTTAYLPLYYGVGSLPEGAGLGTLTHDEEVFNKQHFEDAEFKAGRGALLHTAVLELEKAAEADYGPMRETLKKELFSAEQAFLDGRKKFEADFTNLYMSDMEKGLKSLDEYVAAAFAKVFELTKKLGASAPARR